MRILVIHPGALGDIILALPAIALLKNRYPGARITLAANTDHLAPIRGSCIEEFLSLSSLPLHNLYTEQEIPESDVRFWRLFDRIISWTGGGDPLFVRRMMEVHPRATVATWRPGSREQRHVSQLFVDSLGPEICSGERARYCRIAVDPGLDGAGLDWLGKQRWTAHDRVVAIHPGAGSESKRWPLDNFALLARRIVSRGKKVLVIEGPAELNMASRFVRMLPAGQAIPAERLPLDLLSSAMSRCSAFVGNDSGIAHLAAAIGVPTIVLFGPTLPQHWAPIGLHVTVLRNSSGSLAGISVDEVLHSLADVQQISNIK